jgi:hypothetical protein
MATSATRNAITWTFSADLTVGTYANGDPYVVAPSGVNITAITGATTALAVVVTDDTTTSDSSPNARIKNGSMVNPPSGSSQGFDSFMQRRAYSGPGFSGYFSMSLNKARPIRDSGTDLVIGAGGNTITSATHTFDADDVGCAVEISAGTSFTKGIYKIASVLAGAATLDRVCGTVAATGGTWKVDSELSSSNPLAMVAGESIVSVLSYADELFRPTLTDASILTVVSSAPPANSFRPAYVGTDKTMPYTVADLDYSIFQDLPFVASTPSISIDVARFSRSWLEIDTSDDSRYMHPANNQPDYGADMAGQTGHALLMLQLEFTEAEKEPLMIGLVQYGLDVWAAAKLGRTWQANGGHGNGRKGPLLLAGLTFNDPAILAYANKATHYIFSEDQSTFTVDAAQQLVVPYTGDGKPRMAYALKSSVVTISQATPGVVTWNSHGLIAWTWVSFTTTGTLPSPLVPDTEYWVYSGDITTNTFKLAYTFGGVPINTTSAGSGVHTATFQTLGKPEWGEKHNTSKDRDGANWNAQYRYVVYNDSYMTAHPLAATLMTGGRAAWNWEPFFLYYERVRATATFSGFLNNMWLAYGSGETPETVPTAPSLCVATATGPSQVDVTWQDNSDDESYFSVERANSELGTYTSVGTTAAAATTFTDTTALPNRTYWYRVKAGNAIGPSTASNSDSATTPLPAPAVNVFGWSNTTPGNP